MNSGGNYNGVPTLGYATLSSATGGFSASQIVGTAVSGDVYRGLLNGVPVAVKRLRLPKNASPEMSAELVRRFRAEMDVLSTHTHGRLIHVIGYAMNDDEASASLNPMAIALEFMNEGSLADRLRGSKGEAPKRTDGGPLTPLDRIEIALGVAAGLAYLHGQSETPAAGVVPSGSNSSSNSSTASTTAPIVPVLHRDVKPANVGLRRQAGGGYYSKVLDLGLAKAVKGTHSDAAAADADGTSFTSGIACTLGYMAPEIFKGEAYTVISEVYSFGVLLFELLSGARVAPGTVQDAKEAAADDGVPFTPITFADSAALAGGVSWSPESAAALSALCVDCLQSKPAKRINSMRAVIARLEAIRVSLTPPSAAVEDALIECPTCLEGRPTSQIVRCGGSDRHVWCTGCLPGLVRTSIDSPSRLAATWGAMPCTQLSGGAPCTSPPFTLEALGPLLDNGTMILYGVALRRALFDAPRLKREAEAAFAKQQADALAAKLAIKERIRLVRNVIAERDLNLRCPRCSTVFLDYTGCNCLTCGTCGTGFCAVCLKDCGTSRETHVHYKSTHGGNYYNLPLFSSTHRERRVELLVSAINSLAVEGLEVQRGLIDELAIADLAPLQITKEELSARIKFALNQAAPTGSSGSFKSSMSPDDVISVIGRVDCLTMLNGEYAAAVVFILKFLESHATSAAVCECACASLCGIAKSSAGNRACVSAGAVVPIVAALKSHVASADVCVRACEALNSIAFSSSAGKDACIAAGAVVPIVAALKNHATSADVCENACLALVNISPNSPAGKAACIAGGAVDQIVVALKNHATSAVVCKYACSALWNIDFANPSHSSTIPSEAIPLIAAAYSGHRTVKTIAHELLQKLGYSDSGANL